MRLNYTSTDLNRAVKESLLHVVEFVDYIEIHAMDPHHSDGLDGWQASDDNADDTSGSHRDAVNIVFGE